ncbi:hypothetical protein GCM10007907_01310 [Chitinimonas prasina]|uniref:DUF3592 domain-containing protein n=1 Tax=Chitinimonas prasina TaxID=1434937 RepID=A0ABQ5YCT4_9NEIS|nr:DUF3592 domain-containing protein [Chitinimonas prasina]GLR11341.1 hypothetical protein GCM10007907_01310 [Chitinimonas prasina]
MAQNLKRSWWQRFWRGIAPGILMSCCFVLLGLAALGVSFYPIVQHLRAQHWQPVPGVLQALDYIKAEGRTGRADLYRLEGSYRYRWQGREYGGSRISFSLVSDNLDDGFRERIAARLGPAGSPITVLVNPARPTESVVIADIRWLEFGLTLLGAAMFGLPGAVLLRAMLRKGPVRVLPPGQVSWPLVLGLLATAPLWLLLAWLLWRDDHPVWALVCTLPVMLALNGLRVGLHR